MSYIRCTSNPEDLYVYGSSEGIEFCWSPKDQTQEAFDAASMIAKYEDVWDLIKILHKHYNTFYESHPIQCGDLKIEEVHYSFEEQREVPNDEWQATMFHIDNPLPTESQVKLTIGDKFVYMYRVTWRYLYENLLTDWKYENKKPRANRQAYKLSTRRNSCKCISHRRTYYRTRGIRYYPR